jgi:chemotaxis-related protein WspB
MGTGLTAPPGVGMLVLTFQVGSDRLALDLRRIHEVVPRVRLQRVAGSPSWLAGVFVYRGRIVPVIDVSRLIGAEEYPPHLSTRIILVPHVLDGQDGLLGLLATQVADIRALRPPAQAQPRLVVPGQPDVGPVHVAGGEIIHLVELERLLPEAYRQQLSLVPRELPA